MKVAERVLAFGFLALLAVPLMGLLLWPRTAIVPGAPQTPFKGPARLAEFPPAFEAYFDTHLGFRAALVKTHHLVSYKLMASAPTDTVFVGRDGWVFLNQEKMFESFTGAQPFSRGDLDAWVHALESCQRRIATWGGKFLLVIVPNKETVYIEHMPAWLKARRHETRLDQIAKRLAQTRLPFLNLTGPLVEAKSAHQVYAKLDTHWNGHGALLAAELVTKRSAELLGRPVPLARDNIAIRPDRRPGDLARMMSLEGWAVEERPRAVMRSPKNTRLSPPAELGEMDLRLERQNLVVHEVADPTLPSAVIHRDSFAMALRPLLVDSFRRSVWVWRREFDPNVMSRERPELVIFQLAERYLEGPSLLDLCGS
jgi:hypothetical protein